VTSGEPLFSSINAAKPFGGRAPPGPGRWGSSQRSPRPLAGCRGPLRGGRGGEGRGRGRKGRKGREGRMGREGGNGGEGGERPWRRRISSTRRVVLWRRQPATVENLLSRRRIFYGVVRLKSYPTLWHIFSQYLVYNGNYQQDTT
jgi:hypothetical protein